MSDAFYKSMQKIAARQGLAPDLPVTQMPIDPQPRQALQVPPSASDNAQLAAAWARHATDAARIAALEAEVAEARAQTAAVRDGRAHMLSQLASAVARNWELQAEVAYLKSSVITFCGPYAARYAKERGLPDGHLHPTHYDMLVKAGARMDDFTRADLEAGQ